MKIWSSWLQIQNPMNTSHMHTDSVMYFFSGKIENMSHVHDDRLYTDSVKNNEIQKRHVVCLHTHLTKENERNFTLKVAWWLLLVFPFTIELQEEPTSLKSKQCL